MTRKHCAELAQQFISGAKFDYDLNEITYRNRIQRNPLYRLVLIPSAVMHGIRCANNWHNLMKTFEKGMMLNAHLWR